MATLIQIRRGTKTQLDGITLSTGEIGYTTDTNEVYIGDGTNSHLVGKVMVDAGENRPTAGVSGRVFLDTDNNYTYVDDGTSWISVSAEIDESEVDHNLLHNYVANEHIDHSNVNVLTDGPISGGGDLTADRTIGLNYDNNQLGVSNNDLYIKESGLDHDSLNNTHQNVTTTDSPTFANVTINNGPSDGAHATNKDYVDGLIQGIEWQSSVIDFYDSSTDTPTSPDSGDRYIASTTESGWTADNIYEWDGSVWIETVVSNGMAVWVETADKKYVFNGTDWVVFGETITHNNLSGLQGGSATERYHLSQSAFNNLNDANQSIKTSDSVTFDDVTISNPTNIYDLSHDSFTDYVANEHIDWTATQVSDIHQDNITSLSVTQHEGDINHDALDNYVADEHIDHSGVSVTAGDGLSGGGNITSTKTINIDPDSTTGATVAPINLTANGAGILIDNSSLTHSNGEIEVSLVDGGSFA